MRSGSYFLNAYEADLFFKRYQDPGNPEEQTWEQVFGRAIRAVAHWAVPLPEQEQFLLDTLKATTNATIMPGSPQLWNYGAQRRFHRNGSSCFTGHMGDSLDDFRKADADAERIYVASGGFGLCIDSVRPRGCKIQHCSEGAMGSMCDGGPAKRVEGTTGYITGSGRARGALMLQLGLEHPDAIEFALGKSPTTLGWIDDWPSSATEVAPELELSILKMSARMSRSKDWPTFEELAEGGVSGDDVVRAVAAGIVMIQRDRVVALISDGPGARPRPAARDFDLPLQNCNMSVRVSDEFMWAVEEGRDWAFGWWSKEKVSDDALAWTKTDLFGGGGLQEIVGAVSVGYASSEVRKGWPTSEIPKYGMVIGTWEGLRANLQPNRNQWRDTEYARFFRNIVLPQIGRLSGRIKAEQVWTLICENAWNHGDPGVVFSGTYERFNPVDSRKYGARLSNPCAEFVNPPGGSCNLISVNLRKCAEEIVGTCNGGPDDGVLETKEHWLELREDPAFQQYLEEVGKAARIAARYISAALEYNQAPVESIEEMSRHHFRTVGVGVMGLAEALILFRIRYGSECARSFASASMSEIALSAWEISFELASKGSAKPEAWSPERMRNIFRLRAEMAGRRQIGSQHEERWLSLVARVDAGEYATHTAVTSVAPTGTISAIAGYQMSRAVGHWVAVTSGIEPPFGWGVFRQDSSGKTSTYHDLAFREEHRGKPWMRTASEVSPEEHVEMQAAICDFTCMSASKTVNLPNDATVDDVRRGYELAYRLGVPGTALYRDGSKPEQVLSALECPDGTCKPTTSNEKKEPEKRVALGKAPIRIEEMINTK